VHEDIDVRRASIIALKCNCGAINSVSTIHVESSEFSTRNPPRKRAKNGYCALWFFTRKRVRKNEVVHICPQSLSTGLEWVLSKCWWRL